MFNCLMDYVFLKKRKALNPQSAFTPVSCEGALSDWFFQYTAIINSFQLMCLSPQRRKNLCTPTK